MDRYYGNEYRENLPEQAESMGAYESDFVEPTATQEVPASTAIVKPAEPTAPAVPASSVKKNKWLIIGGILFAGGLIWYLSSKKKR